MIEPAANHLVEKRDEYFPSIDGLRAVAVLLVIFSHLFAFLVIPAFGWTGVDLFFVLSGFLITRILILSKKRKHYLRNFFFRRGLRILPLFFLVLLVSLLVEQIWGLPKQQTLSEYLLYYLTYCQNLVLFIRNNEIEPHLFLEHFWSLSVEEHFYILWPFVVLMLGRKQLIVTCFALLIISRLTALSLLHINMNWIALYTFTFSRFDPLAIGALFGIISLNEPLRFIRLAGILMATSSVLITGILLYSFFMVKWGVLFPDFASEHSYTLLMLFVALFFGGLCYYVAFDKRVKQWFSMPWLVYIGRISYGLYVFHYPVYSIISEWLEKDIPSAFFASIPFKLRTAFISLAVTGLLAVTSFHFFEKRFLKLKQSFT